MKMYNNGTLWGTWSDQKDKKFYGGKPVVINQDGTWTIKGAANNFKVEWNANTYEINLRSWTSHFVTFTSYNTITVTRDKDGYKYYLVKADEVKAEEVKADKTSTSSDSGSGSKEGLYAIIDLDATFKMQSEWSADWAKPRLDSSTGFHNSKEASEQKKDFWIVIEMRKPSEVIQVILSKIHYEKNHDDYKERLFEGIKIEYLEGSDWKSYKSGKIIKTGEMDRDATDAKLMIDVDPFIASKVRVTIPADQVPQNAANAKNYIGGRIDLRVIEK